MTLRIPWPERPALAALQPVAAGLQWICMPLPFALDHVNLWLLDDGDGLLLIDTAVANQQSIEAWKSILAPLPAPPTRLLITHYHPDHIGLAGWFEQQYSLRVLMTDIEWECAAGAFNVSHEDFVSLQARFYREHGLDPQRLAELAQLGNMYQPLVQSLPSAHTTISAGDTLKIGGNDWSVKAVGGHSPDMITLYSTSQNVLIAADQLLPSITPNINLSFYSIENDPLGNFLASFESFADLPDDVLVLPSHGLPYVGLHTRIAQLIAHHQQRCDALLDVCKSPQTAASLLPVLFKRPLAPEQLMFAMGESIAHLRHLELAGALVQHKEHGVRYFSTR